MFSIEKENDLAIDLVSANRALISIPSLRKFFSEASQDDGWEGIISVKGEDLVFANVGEYGEVDYATEIAIETSDYDEDEDEEIVADALGDLQTWQTVSRFVESGSAVFKYEEAGKVRRFEITSGKARQL